MILASELDVDALLQRIADLSREVIGASYGAVGVLDEAGALKRFVYSGIDEETAKKIGDLPRGRGLLGAVVREGRPLRVTEISEHRSSYGFPPNHPPMHTFLGVPIIVRGRIFGRLYLTEKHGAAEFTKDDERIALTLASQAGVAIENANLYDEIRARSQQLARLIEELSSVERVGDLLISGGSLDELLRSVVEEACRLTGASRSTLALLDGATEELVVSQAVGSVSDELIGTRLAPGSSKADAVMKRTTGEVVDDLAADDEVHEDTIRLLGNPSRGAFVPLIVGSRGIGSLACYDRLDGRPFSSDDLVVMQMLANQAAIAIENDRLTEALRDMAVLEERERISKELHDGVIQSIYSVGLSLQGSISMLERDPALSKQRIDESIAELDNVVRDVRSYIFELRPKMVEELGLAHAVRELARDFEVNSLAHTTVRLEDDACDRLREEQHTHVIQVVREILSNIARHARASEVVVSCASDDDEVALEILDDGVGFDPEAVSRGHGLSNMEERARKLGGKIEIEPREYRGTRHLLRVPVGEGRAAG